MYAVYILEDKDIVFQISVSTEVYHSVHDRSITVHSPLGRKIVLMLGDGFTIGMAPYTVSFSAVFPVDANSHRQ